MNNYYSEPGMSSAAIPTSRTEPAESKPTVKAIVCSTHDILAETNDQLRMIFDALGGALDNRPSQSEPVKSGIVEELFNNDTLAAENLKLVVTIRNCLW